MTREEAIQVLQEKIDDRPLFKDEREAFELAIEALSESNVQNLHNGDLISRADAIEAVKHSTAYMHDDLYEAISRIPSAETTGASADAFSREEYEETDGVAKIKKQSAKDVGEIKHIVVCSPNYTRYFYNDSMPTQFKENRPKPDYSYEAGMVRRLKKAMEP